MCRDAIDDRVPGRRTPVAARGPDTLRARTSDTQRVDLGVLGLYVIEERLGGQLLAEDVVRELLSRVQVSLRVDVLTQPCQHPRRVASPQVVFDPTGIGQQL